MQNDLSNRHIVITGGSGALGTAVVTHLRARGAHCWIPCYQEIDTDLATDKHVHQEPNVDLSQEAQVEAFFAKPPSLWASVHIAGGFSMGNIADTSLAQWERMWSMNTVSAFLSCREAVKRMRENTEITGGHIINVAARPVLEPVGGMLAYTTSKAGVAALTQGLACELAQESIAVNAIVPAMMDTPANRKAMPDADFTTWPKTSEIATAIGFLLSPDNATTSGVLLPVYGKLL